MKGSRDRRNHHEGDDHDDDAEQLPVRSSSRCTPSRMTAASAADIARSAATAASARDSWTWPITATETPLHVGPERRDDIIDALTV